MESSPGEAMIAAQIVHSTVIIVLDVVTVIVVGIGVRRQRPDAWLPMLLWSIASLAVTGGSILGGYLYAAYAARFGADELLRAHVRLAYVNATLAVGLVVLFWWALLRLARPPPPPALPAEPPYR
jgi:hypothetical protein